MLKITSKISKKIIVILIILLLSFLLAFFMIPGRVSAEPGIYPIMQPSYETRIEQINSIENGPQADTGSKAMRSLDTGSTLNLINELTYIASERDQGQSGTCWVWAGTGVMEVAKNTQDGIKDRFSIQFFDSSYNGGTGINWAGMGGTLSKFAGFYSSAQMAIPWSNTNAYFQDGSQIGAAGAKIPASAISTNPNYTITSIAQANITTHDKTQAEAISNIKSILNAGKAVVFSFWLPDSASWNNFYTFWSGSAASVYNYDFVDGLAYNPYTGGGHSVLCIGYDDTDPANSYWIMLNSWGTTASRPDGIFRVSMNLNYSNEDSYHYANLTWETLNIVYGAQVASVPVTSISVTGAGNATTVLNGATLQMSAVVLPADATNKDVTWSVVNGTGSASINSTGLLTGTGQGTVTVKPTANDSSAVTNTLEITITAPPPILVTSITVTSAAGAVTVLNGSTLQMSATVLPADAANKNVTWLVTNGTGFASINTSGLLTGTGPGTVTVKATANDGSGITGTKSITVTSPPAPPPPPPGPTPGPAPVSSVITVLSLESPLSNYENTSVGLVTLYYNRILYRAPEEEGLNGWVAALDSGALTGVDVINGFFTSEECQARISGYTNEKFLTFVYKIIFDRPPDAGGLASWMANMSAGMTQREVVNNFARSLEFETLCGYFDVNPYPGYSGSGK